MKKTIKLFLMLILAASTLLIASKSAAASTKYVKQSIEIDRWVNNEILDLQEVAGTVSKYSGLSITNVEVFTNYDGVNSYFSLFLNEKLEDRTSISYDSTMLVAESAPVLGEEVLSVHVGITKKVFVKEIVVFMKSAK